MTPLLPHERAALALEEFRQSGSLPELETAVVAQIEEAIQQERRGLRATIQMCSLVLEKVLELPGLSGEFRAAIRVSLGLCQEGLQEEPEEREEPSQEV